MNTDFAQLYQLYLEHPEVTTDSRRVPEGSLFFALRGDSFNGNLFAAKALEAGAAAVVVDDPAIAVEGDERYVLVEDVLQCLQQLAAHHRQQFKGPVIQITGTNGKTTTKELIAAVLSQRYRVLYTQGNLNNHIGVPLTLLRLRLTEHDLAVIETGANHPGEIDFLTRIVQPDYGLITNVGRAHIEGFGSFEGVKKTKGELYDYLCQKPSARIFINGSNTDLCGMLAARDIDIHSQKCIAYTKGHAQDCSGICEGDVISCDPMLHVEWHETRQPHKTHHSPTHLIGAYNIDNVLSAVAVGLHLGVSPEAIETALAAYQPSLGRSEYRKTEHNELIIDAYNANLTSMQAALDNFIRISHPHKMVILGDMKELGRVSDDAHQQIARLALKSGVEAAWFVGSEFKKAVAQIAAPEGIDVQTFEDVNAVKDGIAQGAVANGRLILIKGSNSTRLHLLPEYL